MISEYSLRCLGCGKRIDDDGTTLSCDCNHNALLRTEYTKKTIEVKDEGYGLYRFSDWLPISSLLEGSNAPVTYKSNGLAKALGLSNLYITFNGYWPEREISMTTGTFKECEAYSVCARLPQTFEQTLVVASAGNTARAFSKVCSENNIPLLVVVPEMNLDAMWFTKPINPNVRLIAAGGNSDYFDAIKLSGILSEMDGFIPEGGAKNVARRDGMSTTVLSAVTSIGRIPDYYFQAVGSGTGAIAAWEANLRFLEDGRFGTNKMSLHVSQNAPFLLIHDSWKKRTRELVELDSKVADKQIGETIAQVLSNRKPPYSPLGGLYDALVDTDGDAISVTNAEALKAGLLFKEKEGRDISPAASVAVGSLIKKLAEKVIDPSATIMLNITGGGIEEVKKDFDLFFKEPDVVVPQRDIRGDNIDAIKTLASKELNHGFVR